MPEKVAVGYDGLHDLVVIEFNGKIDAAEARRGLSALERILPKDKKGWKALVDYSSVDTMDVDVEGEIKKAMSLLNERGVGEIVRVLPDPAAEIGFNVLSRIYYSEGVKLHTFRTRAQAQSRLGADGAA